MNLFFEKRLLTIYLLLSFCGLNALSQSENDSVKQLREVVVTKDARNIQTRSTAPLQILDSEKLASLNALQISDAVKHFSGVTVKDYGGIGGLKTISVRSLGANHTAVSYDGIPISDVQTGQIDIGRFSLENVENVSLNIGQTDNIFQPARMFASASALNIQSMRPTFTAEKRLSGKVGLKSGSFGLLNPTFLLNGKLSNTLSASFSGEWLSANGKYPYLLHYGLAGKDSSSVETRQNTDVKNLRLEGTLFAHFSEKSRANLKAYFYSSERGLPGATIYYNTQNFSSQRIWDRNFFAQAQYEWKISKRWDFQANAKYNNAYLRYLDPATLNIAGKVESIYRQTELYSSLASRFRMNDRISFAAISDLFQNTMTANAADFSTPSRLTCLNAIAGKYVGERLLATASLLHTKTYETVKQNEAANDQQKISPHISISYLPFSNTDLRLRVFYKNIFRLPTFNDLYYTQIGNRKLKPENTNQLNVGLTYTLSTDKRLKILLFTADAYYNDVTNKIVAYPTKNIFEWTMLNYGTVKISGLDLNVDGTIKVSEKIDFDFGTTHTYQRAINKTNINDRNYGHQIPYTPRVSGSAKAGLKTPWVNLNYSMIWSGHRYAVNQNFAENRVAGFTDNSIAISKDILTKMGLFSAKLEMLNMLNKNYEVVRFFPMPGRSFRGSISFKF